MDLTHLAIPIGVLYAGLAGTVLALIVATIQNKWSCRVFFILALRLAIGWHFLFEGLHKVHSYYIGPTETNRPFTSEPYFSVAEGPLGPTMRKQFGDIDAQLDARVKPQNLPAPFAKLTPDQQRAMGLPSANDEDFVKMVPAGVTAEWQRFVADFSERYKLTDAEKKMLDGTLDEQEKKDLEERERLLDEDSKLAQTESGLQSREFELQRQLDAKPGETAVEAELNKVWSERQKIAEERRAKGKRLVELAQAGDLSVRALSSYGRWAAGVDGRASKVKFVSGTDPELSAPQRLEYIKARQTELDNLKKRGEVELGNGYGIEQNRMRDLKALITQSKAALLADADAYLLELKKNAFTAIIQARLSKQAPPPSEAAAAPAKFVALLPPADAPPDAGFDKLPSDVQELWNKYHTAYKANYPDSAAAGADRGFEFAKVRVANWYFGRDEFTGRSAKQDAEKVLADAKAKAEAAQDLTDAERAKLKISLAEAEKNVEKASKARTPFQATVDRYRKIHATADDLQKQAATG
ncbi:MAG TPA: hypothetical protein VKE74_09560, partial [Gemmataceae bacterium]|nr:hypothetical protein [Gemmataceae bacterium]